MKLMRGFSQPAYPPGTKIEKTKAPTNIKGLSRTYVKGSNKPDGNFMMRSSDIKGLNSSQIQNDYAIPETPTYKVDAAIPEGETGRIGPAAKNQWGDGGNTQYELIGEPKAGNYTNPTKLETPAPIEPEAISPMETVDPEVEPIDPELPIL